MIPLLHAFLGHVRGNNLAFIISAVKAFCVESNLQSGIFSTTLIKKQQNPRNNYLSIF